MKEIRVYKICNKSRLYLLLATDQFTLTFRYYGTVFEIFNIFKCESSCFHLLDRYSVQDVVQDVVHESVYIPAFI